MARRRFFRDAGPVHRTRVNHMIRISPIRVIGPDNEQIGVIDTYEAQRMAQEQGLDLVEIQPDARPPICKIMDYGKYKYDQSKKQQKGKGGALEMKEIRLGRSVKIGANDVRIRIDQARKFLMAGHKVQVTQRFRGREMAHKELGIDRLREVAMSLEDISKVEVPPRWAGRQASIIIAPDRQRVESIKAKMSRDQILREEEELRRLEEEQAAEAAREAELDAQEDAEDQAETEAQDGVGTKKGKGPADSRARNPVDDEIANLLGE
ncbi:MAG: translation initiation factor IF-3 [Planctomycetota bacterium]